MLPYQVDLRSVINFREQLRVRTPLVQSDSIEVDSKARIRYGAPVYHQQGDNYGRPQAECKL